MQLNFFSVLLITGFIHGVILLFAINRIKDKNKNANSYLTLLVALISIALIGRLVYLPEIISINMKLGMIPDFILFLFGPISYFYYRSLLTTSPNRFADNWKHYIPAFLHSFYFVIMWSMDYTEFKSKAISGEFYGVMHMVLSAALIHNCVYWFLSLRLVRNYTNQAEESFSFIPRSRYILTLMTISGLSLLLWLISEAITLVPLTRPDFSTYGYVWVLLTFQIYVLGFYAISKPELFRHATSIEKYSSSRLNENEVEEFKEKLELLMREEKVFKNSKLSKLDLVDQIGLNSTELSRIINQGFGKNFFDFVNSYRIEEFVRLVQDPEYANYTYLAIAKEAGFNSKTTFNTAFKKQTSMTPKAYLDQLKEQPLMTIEIA